MKKQELLRRLGKVITGVGAFALAGALFIVPAKADVISDGAADYAKGLAYLQQIKARTEAAAAAQDAAAAADIARGQAYLDQIFASTAAAAAARRRRLKQSRSGPLATSLRQAAAKHLIQTRTRKPQRKRPSQRPNRKLFTKSAIF